MQHLVICGPPHSGKSSLARSLARPVDLVYDFDRVAEALLVAYEPERVKKIHPRAFQGLMELRAALIAWASVVDPTECRVILTVVDRRSAERIAGSLNAELRDLGGQ